MTSTFRARSTVLALLSATLGLAVIAACNDVEEAEPITDGGSVDGSSADVVVDSPAVNDDASVSADASRVDATTCADGAADAADRDAQDDAAVDGGEPDATIGDGGELDAAIGDAAIGDAAIGDADVADSSVSDASDASVSCEDAGQPLVTSMGPSPLPWTTGGSVVRVTGSNFTPCSVVRVQGLSNWLLLPTTYVSSSELTAVENFVRPSWYRTLVFDVFTPGAGHSDKAVSLYRMPVPKISKLVPASAPAGGGAITLKVSSSEYVNEMLDGKAVVYLDSTPLGDAVFTGSYGTNIWYTVSVTVPASLLTTARTAMITVVNPGVPPSPPVPFEIQ